ncbi:helix-turn-helix domain-containing protein, partial [Roseomonas rosulenta]|uniref:helix-turn-helix domain-containing protein n=1 Tax=Roseomonas rosulenta TaxID=2748667 RepID=UPI0018DFD70C
LPATLDAATRARIAVGALPLRVRAGATLFRPGDTCRGFARAGFAAQLGALMGRIEHLSVRSVDARLAADLLDRAPGTVPATQPEIASGIGTLREVVRRRLAAFARAGLVCTERGAVTPLDPAGLLRIKDGTAAP